MINRNLQTVGLLGHFKGPRNLAGNLVYVCGPKQVRIHSGEKKLRLRWWSLELKAIFDEMCDLLWDATRVGLSLDAQVPVKCPSRMSAFSLTQRQAEAGHSLPIRARHGYLDDFVSTSTREAPNALGRRVLLIPRLVLDIHFNPEVFRKQDQAVLWLDISYGEDCGTRTRKFAGEGVVNVLGLIDHVEEPLSEGLIAKPIDKISQKPQDGGKVSTCLWLM